MRDDIMERKDEILQWIKEERPKSFICEQLMCRPETLNSYLKKLGIEYAGQQNKSGQQKGSNKYITAEEYIHNGSYVKSTVLRAKLIRDGIKENKCELCGVSEWMGEILPLELHHKDGNHFNNDFNNLQILCPNCHAIQGGNAGANAGRYKDLVSQRKQSVNHCVDCGVEIGQGATRCEGCYHASTKGKLKIPLDEMPITREELKHMIRTTPFVRIAGQYGVSDNAIRKWCDKYQLPRKVSDIKKYTDEEWEKI